jgi:hypothetical protein
MKIKAWNPSSVAALFVGVKFALDTRGLGDRS